MVEEFIQRESLYNNYVLPRPRHQYTQQDIRGLFDIIDKLHEANILHNDLHTT